MPELALYRKYRPSQFSEVIGQDHVVKVLEGAIKLGNIAHAYLFAGSRGTGKTSVARILARELGTSRNDLYEIDGASNRGIDEIRELREAVRTYPFDSPYKVYIIDEVHMLTKEAFNALLKTLEEPPPHVVFILATTELQRVMETIVSRCQTFVFKKPSSVDLKKFVLRVAKAEGWQLDAESAELIALLGDGSFRDAAGALQKAMSASPDRKIVIAEVASVVGAPSSELVESFITALINADATSALQTVKEVVGQVYDLRVFIKLVLRQLRLALLLKFSPDLKDHLFCDLNADEAKFLLALGGQTGAARLPTILRELLTVHDEVGRSYLPQLPLELAVLRLLGTEGAT